jgi:Capsule assembly protein Wzi
MIRRVAAIVIALGFSSRALSQATPLVPPTARVYRDVERFAAMGLIDTLLLGARPFSEREVLRLLGEAQRNLGRASSGAEWARRTIEFDRAVYQRTSNRIIDAASAELAGMDSPYRAVPIDANGRIDALINPLAAYRQGRPIVSGVTASVETMHSALLGPMFAAVVNPRVTAAAQETIGGQAELKVQSGYLTSLFGNVSVEIGRDYAAFGQAPTGGLLLSNDAPALNLVRLSNDHPWAAPLVSRVFGPLRGSLFLADLGAEHVPHPRSKLIGYHIAALPHPQLEIGVQVVDAMGGNGGQPASFGDRLLDAVPIVDALRTSSDFQFSNKLAGVDLHWRMPRWRGFEFYAEGDADDFDGRNLSRGFHEDAGYLFGTSFSCLLDCGTLGIRAEYHQTGIRYYTHSDYPISMNQLLLGDPLGPRGVGGYVTIDRNSGPSDQLSFAAAFEARSGNTYRSATTGAHEEGFHFELVDRRPSEKRARLTATWTRAETTALTMSISAGVERAANFAFIGGNDRTNLLGRFVIIARP